MAVECFDLPELTGEISANSPILTESTDYFENAAVEQEIFSQYQKLESV